MKNFEQVKKDLQKIIWDTQRGMYDRQDKVRHEAGCPRGVSIMRLQEIADIHPRTAALAGKILRDEGRLIIHNEGSIDLSFEAVEPED